nr:ATP-grasp domain-containing protein [endosymbiont 'TC1' of Trimyema compressum]
MLKAGGKVAPYKQVNSFSDLEEAVKEIGFPCVLKTRQDGYDGKGQIVLKGKRQLKSCVALLKVPCILEAFISFDYEASVVGTRGTTGEVKLFPIGYNIHKIIF